MATMDNEIFHIISSLLNSKYPGLSLSTANNCSYLTDTLVLDNARLFIKKLKRFSFCFCENLVKSTSLLPISV